ncbi:MAG: acyltransferase family protein [Acidimicrobiales bacterium]
MTARDRPVELAVRGRYLPALDGVRALAILGVFAYHLGFGWASGGYLGVDLFFVLSGFLITSLLIEERLSNGRIALPAFWGRRALRLLPGLLLLLLVLGAFLAVVGPGPLVDPHAARSDAIATILYVANWHQLFAHQSYFAQFSAPSPLQHTWSLAIEEQFYLLWPLLVAAVFALSLHLLRSSRRRALPPPGEGWRHLGLALAGCGAAASAAWMAWLALHGAGSDRLYYGTDTRAFDLLAGAVLAWLVAGRPQPGDRARRLLGFASPAAAVLLGIFWWRASAASTGVAGGVVGTGGAPGRWMFEWGFLVCAVSAVFVIADLRQTRASPLARALSVRPLRFIGRISYELYLWHWPVISEMTASRVHLSGLGLDGLRLAAAVVLASVSYFLVDQPIRRWGFRGLPSGLRWSFAPFGMAAAAGAMVLGTVPVAAAAPVSHVSVGGRVPVPGAGGVVGGPIRLPAPPSRLHPLRIVLFGDSVMKGQAPAIAAALDSTGVVQVVDQSFDGWGLTTDRGWRENVPAAIEKTHAELAIAMWEWDDYYYVTHRAEYRAELAAFVRTVIAAPGLAGLVFEQYPPLGPRLLATSELIARDVKSRNNAMDAWDALARSLVSLDPAHVVYLPVAPAVERAGKWTSWLPPDDDFALPSADWVRVRAMDSVHFCPPGAARYAAALETDLRAMFRLPPPSPSWSTGAWADNQQLFEQPAGNCPADHPAS